MIRYKIVLYEDESDIRRFIKDYLYNRNEHYEVVGDFSDCSQVREQMERLKPDIVLLDIQMPNVDGLKGLLLIKKYFPKIKVMMLTNISDEDTIIRAIEIGCDGYMLKDELPFGIERALQEIIRGEAHLTPSVAKKLMKKMQKPSLLGFPCNPYKLTPQEQKVLALLAKAYTRREIAKELNVSENTVGTHVKSLYEKLQVSSKAAAVRKAIEEQLLDGTDG